LPDGRLRAGWRALLGIIVVVLANIIAGVIAAVLVGRHGPAFDLVYRPLVMVLLIAGFSLLLLYVDRVRQGPLAAQGLPRQRWLPDSVLGVLIGGAMIVLSVVVIGIWGSLSFQITATPQTVPRGLLVLLMLAAAAMAEELMFRGYPFQRLVESIGAVGAIVALSILFGAVHLGNPHASVWAVVNTITVGALLAVAYLRTRALWLPWGIHLGWNATLGLVFGLPVSGIDQFAVVVKGSAAGPQWLTGGDYGLEASVLGTVMILLGFIPVLKLFRQRRPESVAELSPPPQDSLVQPDTPTLGS
jgi:hypothetical protein